MLNEKDESKTNEELLKENIELKARLNEAEDTLNAIQNGEVDAIITPQGSDGPQVYTLESADTLYRHLVQEMGESIATLTLDGTIFYGNAQLASLIKVPLDKIIGMKLKDFIPPEDLETYQMIFNEGLKTRSKGEINIKSADGNIIPVHISINHIKDLKGVYIVITDLSEQKYTEELKIAQEELENSLEALKKSEKSYKNIIENIQDAYIRADNEGKIIMASPSAARMYRFNSTKEMIGITANSLYKNPESRAYLIEELYKKGKVQDFESEALRKDGTSFLVSLNAQFHYDDQFQIKGTEAFVRDINERKKAEFERETTIEFLHIVNTSTNVKELIHSALTFFKRQSGCEAVGIRLQEGQDYPYYEARGFPEEFLQVEDYLCEYDEKGNPCRDSEGNPIVECMCGNVICGRVDSSKPFFTTNGSFWTNNTTNLLANTTEEDRQSPTRNRCNGEGYESVALIPLNLGYKNLGLLQLNDRKKNIFSKDLILIWERLARYMAVALAKFIAEEKTIMHDRLLNGINQIFQESLTCETERDVIRKSLEVAEEITESEFGFFSEINEDKQLDNTVLSFPDMKIFETLNVEGLPNMEMYSYWKKILKVNESQIINKSHLKPDFQGLTKDHPVVTSFLSVPLKQGKKTIGMIGLANKKGGYTENDKFNLESLSTAFEEALMRKRAEIRIQKNLKDLARSNKELEQFAHITSHDLREPLRMITSFLQLLERRYKDKLDQDANEFIAFAVDGAKRLDAMTNDLLQYSKITSQKREFTPVNLDNVFNEALINLKVPIEDNNVIITHDPLPTIIGDELLMVQLFQNLIGNSIKYRSQETPKIHISATKEKDQYLFSIKDNGIGILPEHLNKIFTIFQRLHTNEEYEGTGIGLAIAQKIVHQHGGEIWVESEPGKGSTFYFTIPKNV